ncbi:MAG: hypothetical protein H0V17_06805, partial [Deltaproteobacteria bacterium]|nr:hypothetical protein [Deltaproteobacteria bacterium]
AATVERALDELVKDGELSAADVDALFAAAGDTVSKAEMLVVRDAVAGTTYTVPAAATERALELATVANLLRPEVRELMTRGGYGGNVVPAKVRALLAKARLNGAAAFDVRETDASGEGVWNPYPTTTPPTENMTFQHTVVTPDRLAADLANTTVEYNAITGVESVTSGGQTFEQVTYAKRRGGTGNIVAQYDEAFHPDIFARGSSNQIWASNCGFLSDGTIHCLPAARRSELQDLILTNPHLSRCSDFAQFADDCHTMLYIGHITASAGVITSVEFSGRLSKEIARGRINAIDPIALFQAWGFKTSPSLTIQYGNTSDGRPVRDVDGGVVRAP